jgi:hypothetical protein
VAFPPSAANRCRPMVFLYILRAQVNGPLIYMYLLQRYVDGGSIGWMLLPAPLFPFYLNRHVIIVV